MSELWAITCYFNPMGYARRRDNYVVFRRHLTVPLVAVELSYHDGFDLPLDAAEIMIRVNGGDVLWQKERLLNLALSRLPPRCDQIAWLDCDIVFERGDWATQAARALQRYPILQPYRRVYEPPPDGYDPSRLAPKEQLGFSVADLLSRGIVTPEILHGDMRRGYRTNSGLAWVARRELLDRGGFYDACIMGSGNRAMLCGALGTPADAITYLQMTRSWAAHYRAWAARHFQGVGGNVGCVDGTVIHLWHGDLENRRYSERHHEFAVFGYDPAADIAADVGGGWRWSSTKPDMHAYVAEYFRSRREDGDAEVLAASGR